FENETPTPPEVTVNLDYNEITNGDIVDLGNIELNEGRQIAFQIVNSGEARLIIEDLVSTGDIVVNGTVDTLFQQFAANLLVSVPATTLGNATATISFNSNDENISSFSVELNYDVVNAMEVTATVPATGNVHQEADTPITITFDEDIDMANDFTDLIQINGSVSGNIDFTASTSGNTVDLTPDSDLHPGERVNVTLNAGIMSSGGLNLVRAYSFHFDVITGASAQQPVFFRTQTLLDLPQSFNLLNQADYNNDGITDFLVNSTTSFQLINGQADGSFELATTSIDNPPYTSEMTTADFNNDGYPDVLLHSLPFYDGIAFLVNDQMGQFTVLNLPVEGTISRQATAADLNGDGLKDIVLFQGKDLLVLLNEGDFNFKKLLITTDIDVSFTLRANIVVTDMDRDGFTDIVAVLGDGFGETYWFQNDGYLNFTSHTAGSFTGRNLFVTDFDNDSDLDIITGEASADGFKVNINDGDQNFSSAFVSNLDYRLEHLVDFDGDQDFDGLAFEINSSNILTLENNGALTIGEIDPNTTTRGSVTLDIDGDGDLDIVATARINQVDQLIYFENDAPIPPVFQLTIGDRQLSSGDTIKANLPAGIENAYSFQIKNTGEVSLVMDSIHRNESFTLLDPTPITLENNRNQQVRFTLAPQTEGTLLDSLTFRYNIPGDSITRIYFDLVIEPSVSIVSSMPALGKDMVTPDTEKITIVVSEDLMAESVTTDNIKVYGRIGGPLEGQLLLENPTTVSFSPDKEFIVGDDISVVFTKEVTAVSGNRFIKPGSTSFAVGQRRRPTTITGFNKSNISNAPQQFYHLADFDQSGIPEIYFYESFRIVRIDGFEVESPTDISFEFTRESQPGDMDNDGDMDIVISTINDLFWLENIDGDFSTTHRVSDGPLEVDDFLLGDVNGDGRLDIVTLPDQNQAIAVISWLENTEEGFIRHEVAVVQSSSRYLNLLDFDKDGDLDLLYTGILVSDAANNRTVLWSENLGNGTFQPFSIILAGLNTNGGSLVTSDYDRDGDIDLFVNEAFGGIIYLENDGTMQFSQSQFSDSDRLSLATDIDGDSDIDLLKSNGTWMINDGGGNFSELLLEPGNNSFGLIKAGDYNGDGDLDIFSSNFSGGLDVYELRRPAELQVQSDGITLANDATLDFGITSAGNPTKKKITIRNTGEETLIINGTILPSGYMVTPALPDEIAAGESFETDIVFEQATSGTYSGDLEFSFDNLATYSLNLTAEVDLAPEIDITFNSDAIISGDTIRLTGSHTSPLLAELRITNIGDQVLNLSNPTLPAGITQEGSLMSSLGFGTNDADTLRLSFSTAEVGSATEEIAITNDDPDENPFIVIVEWEVSPAPEVTLFYEGAEVSQNEVINLSIEQTLPLSASFTITNTGTADLELTNPTLSEQVTLVTDLPESIGFETDNSVNAVFLLNTDTPGDFSETINIPNSDLDEDPLTFTIEWEVTPTPEAVLSYEGQDIDNDAVISGLVAEQTTALSATVTITNTGTADLELTNPTLSERVTLVTDLPESIGFETDNSVDVVFLLNTDTPGDFSETINITNNDLDENPLSFTIEWEVTPTPEVILSYEGQDIDNDAVISGLVAEQTTALSATVTITNTGTTDLALTNPTLSEKVTLVTDLPESIGFETDNSVDVVFLLNTDT
ncbi:MAG: FG-GAP-like repeat-containing protein, partial [Bacteroidota bacterium]